MLKFLKRTAKREISISQETANLRFLNLTSQILNNPDELIQRRGWDIYDEMTSNNAEIYNSYQLKKVLRLSTGWDIMSGDEADEKQEEIRKFVKWNFKMLGRNVGENTLEDFLMKMWDMMKYGYRIAEKIWEINEKGQYKDKIILKKLVVRKSKNYQFETDEHGRLRKRGLIEDPFGSARRLPIWKFTIWTWEGPDNDGSSLYGKSDFRVLFDYYWASELLIRYWVQAMEKISRPRPIAYYEKNLTDKERERALEALDLLWDRASMLVPAHMKVDILETKTRSSDFERILDWMNQMIRKGLMVGERLIEGGTGSYALSETQFNVLLRTLDYLAVITETRMNEIIRELVDYNWDVDVYPSFFMPRLSDGNIVQRAKTIMMLAQFGVIQPEEEWVRQWLLMPSLKERDVLPRNRGVQENLRKTIPIELRRDIVTPINKPIQHADKMYFLSQVVSKIEELIDEVVKKQRTSVINLGELKQLLIKHNIDPQKAFEICGKIKEALVKQSVYLLDYKLNPEGLKKLWAETLLQ